MVACQDGCLWRARFARPMMIPSYTVPEANAQFRQRGGRFGSPSANESMRRCLTLVFLEMPAMKTWVTAALDGK
jgi:hypothetical protein